MLEPLGMGHKAALVSQKRLGVAHIWSVVYQVGMAVAQNGTGVARKEIRVMAGREAALGIDGGVVGAELSVP